MVVPNIRSLGSSPALDPGLLQDLLACSDLSDERGLLSAATLAVVNLLGDRGSCVLIDGAARVALSTSCPTVTNLPIDLTRYPEITAALDERRLIDVEDAQRDARLEVVREMLPDTLRSIAAVPLLLGEHRLGALTVQCSSVRRLSPQAIAGAELIGRLTAHMLDAVRLRRELGAIKSDRSSTRAHAPSLVLALTDCQPPEARPLSATTPKSRRLLIVEDEHSHASAISAILEENGFAVEVAHNRGEGLERARQTQPDLVLLDGGMPVLGGPAVAEQLRRDPATQDIPILLVSGCDDAITRVGGIGLEGMDFIAKPISAPELLLRVERLLEQRQAQELLRRRANSDELTGLGNLRFLRERLRIEQSRFDRYGTPLAMIMIDVDKLKRINDRFGHVVGSQVLAAIGRVLRAETRETDLAVRYGGDEFVAVLAHASLADAMRFAQRALTRIRALRFGGARVTVSMGVALACHDQASPSTDGLLKAADAAAYHAKRLGGDRVCAFREVDASHRQGSKDHV